MSDRTRIERIENNLCIWCGKIPPVSGIQCCQKCREIRSSTEKEQSRIKRQLGICTRCPMPAAPGSHRCRSCLDKDNTRAITKYYSNADQILSIWDSKCVACGETEYFFLTLDHIKNDGYCDKQNGIYKKDLVRNIPKGLYSPDGLQCLCHNCQLAKVRNNGNILTSDSTWTCCLLPWGKCIHTKGRIARMNKTEYDQRYWRLRVYETLLKYSTSEVPICVCCGCDNIWYLTLDHIDDTGAQDRAAMTLDGSTNMYSRVRKLGYPDGYQTMCANCNFGRSRNNRICPHKQLTNSSCYATSVCE